MEYRADIMERCILRVRGGSSFKEHLKKQVDGYSPRARR